MPGDILVVTPPGSVQCSTGVYWVEARDAAKHPTVHSQPLPQRIRAHISIAPRVRNSAFDEIDLDTSGSFTNLLAIVDGIHVLECLRVAE